MAVYNLNKYGKERSSIVQTPREIGPPGSFRWRALDRSWRRWQVAYWRYAVRIQPRRALLRLRANSSYHLFSREILSSGKGLAGTGYSARLRA
jgi:hypothetical protein